VQLIAARAEECGRLTAKAAAPHAMQSTQQPIKTANYNDITGFIVLLLRYSAMRVIAPRASQTFSKLAFASSLLQQSVG
jgi:hypothetical protein